MPGLIQKSGYIKPGNGGGHYAEYIATREGVELIEAPSPSHDGGGYLEYMAQRPRSHGLFSADGPADLEKTMEEINLSLIHILHQHPDAHSFLSSAARRCFAFCCSSARSAMSI